MKVLLVRGMPVKTRMVTRGSLWVDLMERGLLKKVTTTVTVVDKAPVKLCTI